MMVDPTDRHRSGEDSRDTSPLNDGGDALVAADRELDGIYTEPMSLSDYVDTVLEQPSVASHASKYLLDAIESTGTRKVIERGEERERYRFFDDPSHDGEHAIHGNTAVLNAFVDDLRSIASGHGKDEIILWIAGPTATGKSELKRCLISGLRAFSKTPEGRRYTIEWNITTSGDGRSVSYGEPADDRGDHWYRSPIQVNPLYVFPSAIRSELVDRINTASEDHIDIRLDGELDPFSREAYRHLETHYRRRGRSSVFSRITDPDHLRVANYVVDVGQGIGVLHAEDGGSPKQRLVGGWMRGMLRELDSQGRKDPRAFSYDGVLSQGNGGITIVEDAAQHADLLQKLLSVPDESRVKLDTGIDMMIDTLLVIISNPDLEAHLDHHSEAGGADPLKALKRRLAKHEFHYLTNLSLEVELLRRELIHQPGIWTAERYADLEARIREGITIPMGDGNEGVIDRELAPHTIEAAALYAVLTRLSAEQLPEELDLIDKAILYDRGYLFAGDDRRERADFEFDDRRDGLSGIPVTYTRDIIADLLQHDQDRSHPSFAVEHVIMPNDVLEAMVDDLSATPLFSRKEQRTFEDRVVSVKAHIAEQQEADVLDAILADVRVDESTLEEYVQHVFAWGTSATVKDDNHEALEPDALWMKVVEVERLGRFTEGAYDGTTPSSAVEAFREEQIITGITRHAWDRRADDFTVEAVNLREIPTIRDLLERSEWADVHRLYPDFEPRQWDDPPAQTETAEVKTATIEVMVEDQGYTPASAELTSRSVMESLATRRLDDYA